MLKGISTVSGIMLTMLMLGMLIFTFNVQSVKTGLVERKVGVNVGDWAEYKNYTFSWESDVPYDELENETKLFIKNYEDIYSWKITVIEVSGTLVNYELLLRFKNGTEQAIQTFVDIETGLGSNMWLISANLSAGDSIYTHYRDWIITETLQSIYLGESREVNLLLGKTVNYTLEPYMVSLNFTIVWDKLTGILLEWHGHGLLNAIENNQTVTYRFNLRITGTNRWGYKMWIVDDDGPADFHTIQEAIDAANDGDMIFVKNGTYYENIFVSKSISLIGESPKSTIIDGSNISSSFNPVIYVYGNNIKICNFTIRGSSNAWGIYILTCENIWIENNLITENHGGIVSDFSNNVTLIKNNITNNEYEGLLLFGSSKNILKNNTISGNKYNFGVIEKFDHDIDASNKIDGKTIYYLKDQKDLTINQNSFPDLGYLALINCTNIIVENLSIANNYNGLLLVEIENSTVKNNSFQNNMRGIDIINSSNNTLTGNNVTDCGWIGISLVNSPNNTFKENDLSNNELSFTVDGDSLNDFIQNLDLSNTVDGKLMRYLINCTNLIVNPSVFNDTGYFAFVNSYNITVEDLSLQNNELLFAFSRSFSIIRNNISDGTIKVVYSSFANLTENVILDGQSGILIHHTNNTCISKNKIAQNWNYGINLQESSFNMILQNEIKSNRIGISIQSSNDNTIVGNSITENKEYGILLTNSYFNKIFHNNFINNTRQAVCSSIPPIASNVWDNGYPSGGNYWSDYAGNDAYSGPYQNDNGSDGIGDTSYIINGCNKDNYPLMGPFNTFDVGVWDGVAYKVDVISNSTVSDFHFNPKEGAFLRFNVTGINGTAGFCRVTIPKSLLWAEEEKWDITVDGQPVNYTIIPNKNYTYLYFTYNHSTKAVVIQGTGVVPEFPSTTILTLLMLTTLITTILLKRKRKPKPQPLT